MKILSITAQKPTSTGSGVYLTELVKELDALGHEQTVVGGIYRDDEVEFPQGVRFDPVYFQSEKLPYNIVGMSDEMPYPNTRYCDMTPEMVEQFRQAFLEVLRPLIDTFQPDLILCHHLYLLTAIVREAFPKQRIFGFCHNTDLRQMQKTDLERRYIAEQICRLDHIFVPQTAQEQGVLQIYQADPGKITLSGMGYNNKIFRKLDHIRHAETCYIEKLEEYKHAKVSEDGRIAVDRTNCEDGRLTTDKQMSESKLLAEDGQVNRNNLITTDEKQFAKKQETVEEKTDRNKYVTAENESCPADIRENAGEDSKSTDQCEKEHCTRIIFVGKISEKKGLFSLIRSMDYLPKDRDIRFYFAGGAGNQQEYRAIRALAEASPFPVHFYGKMPQSELAAFYNRCDIFVLPSFCEGIPLTVIEALACGCRVVMTRLPGIPEWLEQMTDQADIRYVDLPEMRNTDEPVPETLPAFEKRLAETLLECINAGVTSPADVSRISWSGIAKLVADEAAG